MSLLKFGFITLFLSDALVSGYTAAAAFTIFITQIAAIFGLNPQQAALPADMHFFTTPQVCLCIIVVVVLLCVACWSRILALGARGPWFESRTSPFFFFFFSFFILQ